LAQGALAHVAQRRGHEARLRGAQLERPHAAVADAHVQHAQHRRALTLPHLLPFASPVLSRTTSSTPYCTSAVRSRSTLCMTSSKARQPLAPIRCAGCSTVVRPGQYSPPSGIPSKPTTETSSGTLTPCCSTARMQPRAIASLPSTTAPGRARGGCARKDCAYSTPDSGP